MKFLIGIVSFLAITATYPTWAVVNLTDYENNMIFYTFNSQGSQMNFTFANNNSFLQMCSNNSNWTIVSHAWQESFRQQAWQQSVVDSFVKFRGGCVMFMDYG